MLKVVLVDCVGNHVYVKGTNDCGRNPSNVQGIVLDRSLWALAKHTWAIEAGTYQSTNATKEFQASHLIAHVD